MRYFLENKAVPHNYYCAETATYTKLYGHYFLFLISADFVNLFAELIS